MTEKKEVEIAEVTPDFKPEHSLDFYVKKRAGNKREYIFRYKKARKCDHPTMQIIARGGNMYRCTECNYSFQWPGAIVWPLHFTVLQGAFQIMSFVKEFGEDALEEVFRTPIGQTDGTPHKPVLPEGMSFSDVLQEMEAIDVTTADGGKSTLATLLDKVWVGPPALDVGGGNGSGNAEAIGPGNDEDSEENQS